MTIRCENSGKSKIGFVGKLLELCHDVNVDYLYIAWLNKLNVIAIKRDDFEVGRLFLDVELKWKF